MALKQVEDHYNSLSPAEREAYKRKYYPKSSSAIDRLSRSIESDHAYMSDAEWEAPETIRFLVGSKDFHTGRYIPDPRYPGVGEGEFVEIKIEQD